jgi:hypothetical protein
LGDGLVPVASALGQHKNRERCLEFELGRQAIVSHCGHLDLLSSVAVFDQLRRWLS